MQKTLSYLPYARLIGGAEHVRTMHVVNKSKIAKSLILQYGVLSTWCHAPEALPTNKNKYKKPFRSVFRRHYAENTSVFGMRSKHCPHAKTTNNNKNHMRKPLRSILWHGSAFCMTGVILARYRESFLHHARKKGRFESFPHNAKDTLECFWQRVFLTHCTGWIRASSKQVEPVNHFWQAYTSHLSHII